MNSDIVLVSGMQQSESVIHILFPFHYGLLQDIEYDSLYYAVGPCCLIFIYGSVYLERTMAPTPSPLAWRKSHGWRPGELPSPWGR